MIAVPCNSCSKPLPEWELTAGERSVCPDCNTEHQTRIFPAALRKESSLSVETAAEGEATCFDHPSSRAVAACSNCGAFVCQLCLVEAGAGVLCPRCVATGVSKPAQKDAGSRRVAYDSMALTVALAPLILFPFTIFGGPTAVFLTFRYWKRPLPLLHRNRWRFVVAAIVGILEAIGWIWLIAYSWLRAARGR